MRGTHQMNGKNATNSTIPRSPRKRKGIHGIDRRMQAKHGKNSATKHGTSPKTSNGIGTTGPTKAARVRGTETGGNAPTVKPRGKEVGDNARTERTVQRKKEGKSVQHMSTSDVGNEAA